MNGNFTTRAHDGHPNCQAPEFRHEPEQGHHHTAMAADVLFLDVAVMTMVIHIS